MSVRSGKLQFEIMEVLWRRGEASARQVTDDLNGGKGREVAHSTVQTLLRKLLAKGAVAHREEERTFIFRAVVKRSKAKRSAARDLIDRAFGGSAAGLIAHLLREESIPAEELRELRKLLKRHEEDRHGK